MRYSPRQQRLRDQRAAFLLFVTLAFAYLLAGVPLAASAFGAAAAERASGLPSFEELDANHDGYVDSSETARYSAYASAFARADASADGRLSRSEFASALRRLERSP